MKNFSLQINWKMQSEQLSAWQNDNLIHQKNKFKLNDRRRNPIKIKAGVPIVAINNVPFKSPKGSSQMQSRTDRSTKLKRSRVTDVFSGENTPQESAFDMRIHVDVTQKGQQENQLYKYHMQNIKDQRISNQKNSEARAREARMAQIKASFSPNKQISLVNAICSPHKQLKAVPTTAKFQDSVLNLVTLSPTRTTFGQVASRNISTGITAQTIDATKNSIDFTSSFERKSHYERTTTADATNYSQIKTPHRLLSQQNEKAVFSAQQTTRHSMQLNRPPQTAQQPLPLPPQTTHMRNRQTQLDKERHSKLEQQIIPVFERRNEIKWDEHSAFVKKKVLPMGGRHSPRANRSLFQESRQRGAEILSSSGSQHQRYDDFPQRYSMTQCDFTFTQQSATTVLSPRRNTKPHKELPYPLAPDIVQMIEQSGYRSKVNPQQVQQQAGMSERSGTESPGLVVFRNTIVSVPSALPKPEKAAQSPDTNSQTIAYLNNDSRLLSPRQGFKASSNISPQAIGKAMQMTDCKILQNIAQKHDFDSQEERISALYHESNDFELSSTTSVGIERSRFTDDQLGQLKRASNNKRRMERIEKNFQPLAIKKSLLVKSPPPNKQMEIINEEEQYQRQQRGGTTRHKQPNFGFTLPEQKGPITLKATKQQSSVRKHSNHVKITEPETDQKITPRPSMRFLESPDVKPSLKITEILTPVRFSQNFSTDKKNNLLAKHVAAAGQKSMAKLRFSGLVNPSGENSPTNLSMGSFTGMDTPIRNKGQVDLLDRTNLDPFVQRLKDEMAQQADYKKRELEEYINCLNEEFSNQDKIILKKGGKVKFPEPSFSILSLETKKMIKKKFAHFLVDNLESEPTISYALININSDKQQKKQQAARKQEMEIQNQLQDLSGGQFNPDFTQFDPVDKELGAIYSFMDLVNLEKSRTDDNKVQFGNQSYKELKPYEQEQKQSKEDQNEEKNPEDKQNDIVRQDPNQVFIQHCHDENHNPIPILSTVTNRTLSLGNYTLSSGHCDALNQAAKYFDNFVNRVRLQNCGVDDGKMAKLISTFSQLRDFKSIILRQNVFQEKSLEAIRGLLQKKAPYNMSELRLASCDLPKGVMKELLSAIAMGNQLKKLELSNAKLDYSCLTDLVNFINDSMRLEELDISWNQFNAAEFDTLFQTLSKNKRLHELNLSWNNVSETEPLRKSIKTNNPRKHRLACISAMTVQNVSLAHHLRQFIWINRKLIHVDLSYTNLSEAVVYKLIPGIRKSKTLMSIHVSGNPGITEMTKQYAKITLKCKPQVRSFEGLDIEKVLKKNNYKRILPIFQQEATKMKQIANQKWLESERTNIEGHKVDNHDQASRRLESSIDWKKHDSKLIFQRKLGYQEEDPTSDTWQMLDNNNDQCWICDRQIRSFVFWFDGLEKDKSVVIPTDLEEKGNLKTILERNFDFQSLRQESPELDGRAPIILGSFTSWQPKKMWKLLDYLQECGPMNERVTDLQLLKLLKEQEIKRKKKNKFGLYEEDEGILFDESKTTEARMASLTLIQRGALVAIKENYLAKLYEHWHGHFEQCFGSYKKPFLVNGMNSHFKQYDSLYVFPTFISSGRQRYVIQRPCAPSLDELHAPDLELFRSIVDFRDEDITPWPKNVPHRDNERVFVHTKSVFAHWRQDTAKSNEECWAYDRTQRKTLRYVVDPDETERVEQIFKEYFAPLKAIFTEFAASTYYPKVDRKGFAQLLTQCDLVNKKHSANYFARHFERAISSEETGKKAANCSRAQFFELILRLARDKYYDIQKELAQCEYAEAVKLFANDDLRNLSDKGNWQTFRVEELYCIDVNDVLKANLDKIQMVYSYFQKRSKLNTNGQLHIQDGIKLFNKTIRISEQQCLYAIGMSKMTIVNDGASEYKTIAFVEFLEAIGRIAKLKFAGTSRGQTHTLAEKIEYALDDILEVINLQRNEVVIDGEEQDDQFESEEETYLTEENLFRDVDDVRSNPSVASRNRTPTILK